MRFDEASTRYGDFGPFFYTGMVAEPGGSSKWRRHTLKRWTIPLSSPGTL